MTFEEKIDSLLELAGVPVGEPAPPRLHQNEPGQWDDDYHYPRTLVLNEGWLLRLALEWHHAHKGQGQELLRVENGETWFSEGIPRSPFRPAENAPGAGEGRTHIDGVIGRFAIRPNTKAGIVLQQEASRLVVIEAKIASPIGRWTQNTPPPARADYDQIARTAATALWALWRGGEADAGADGVPLRNNATLSVLLVAPESGCDTSVLRFRERTEQARRARVRRGIEAWLEALNHEGPLAAWWVAALDCLETRTTIELVSWQEIAAAITASDRDGGEKYETLLNRCLGAHGIPAAIAEAGAAR